MQESERRIPSVTNRFTVCMCLAVAGAAALALAACGGGSSGGSVINPQPVQAQSTFSASSLSGTYAISFIGASVSSGSIAELDNGIGTIQLDGGGNIVGGSIVGYGSGGTCTFSLSGTYAVQPTGSGSLSLTVSPSASSATSCGTGGSGALAIELGQSGASFTFAESDYAVSGSIQEGTAVKQE
jgi:hypothetical protein